MLPSALSALGSCLCLLLEICRAAAWSNWSWWGGSSVGWGLAGLAAGALITSLVNRAAQQQKTVIVVPGTNLQLNYSSIEAVGVHGASFTYEMGGNGPYMGAANCQLGLFNGQVPVTADQAQLLHAVCTIAYGAGS